MKFRAWQPVKVINEEHPRAGLAGTVCGVNPEKPEQVEVNFDVDGIRELVNVDDLKSLV